MTTLSTAGALQALQHEVQRLLGRCLLRLQQYEHLIKALVGHHEIEGPAHALESIRAARVADTASKTLGTLVGNLLTPDDLAAINEAVARVQKALKSETHDATALKAENLALDEATQTLAALLVEAAFSSLNDET